MTRDEARAQAERLAERVAWSMALEGKAVPPEVTAAQIEEMAEQILAQVER